MWTTAGIAIIAMTMGFGADARASGPIDGALDQLASCPDLTARVCMRAAATLRNEGRRAIRPTLARMPEMGLPGQILSLTVIEAGGGRHATRALIQVVEDTSFASAVRTMAMPPLNIYGRDDRRATRALLGVLHDPESLVRAGAARTLGNRPHKGNRLIIQALIRTATTDTAIEVRVEALIGLGFSGRSEVGPTLVLAVADSIHDVRVAGAKALRMVKYPPSIPTLIEALDTPDAAERQVVAAALRSQTGEGYGDDYAMWREWFDANQ